TGQRRDEDVARLSLPPRIDYRTTASADDLPVPNPRLRIDRFTDGSEQPETREIAPLRELLAPLHEGSGGSGRRVADPDAVLLDDAPDPVLVGVVGRSLVHEGRRAVRQGPVHDVGVAGNPADVGSAPVDVVVVQIEDPLVGRADAGEITAGRVDDALGLAGRTRSVEEGEQILGVHRLGPPTARA